LGVDFLGAKNMIGVFANPRAVLIDANFLHTLPVREIRSGFAEILKHALIADAKQWAAFPSPTDWKSLSWASIVKDSVAIKRRIVEEDPLEAGIRKALNFGHTIGHAVESLYLGTTHHLLHGEAIALGIVCEAYLSSLLLGLPLGERNEIATRITTLYGKVTLDKSDFETLIGLMRKDKKNEAEEINFSLLPRIGDVRVNESATPKQIIESLEYYQGL
jgi:3-dehydroquinate synthase